MDKRDIGKLIAKSLPVTGMRFKTIWFVDEDRTIFLDFKFKEKGIVDVSVVQIRINCKFRWKLRSSATLIKFDKRPNFPKNEIEIYFFFIMQLQFLEQQSFSFFFFWIRKKMGKKHQISPKVRNFKDHSFQISIIKTISVSKLYIYVGD